LTRGETKSCSGPPLIPRSYLWRRGLAEYQTSGSAIKEEGKLNIENKEAEPTGSG